MILSSYKSFDHTSQKDEKRNSGTIVQYVFYHIPPTVLADFNIYLLGKKSDISKKKETKIYVMFCVLFCIFGFHSFFLKFPVFFIFFQFLFPHPWFFKVFIIQNFFVFKRD
jgi:hypothetical protein